MNILIIASYYEQDKNIASVRWTNFAYRLASRHKIFVLSEPLPGSTHDIEQYESAYKITVMRMKQVTIYEKLSQLFKKEQFLNRKSNNYEVLPKDRPSSFIKQVIRKAKNRLCLFAEYIMAKQQKKYILKQFKKNNIKFDIVISSAKPLRQFLVGAMLAKELKCAWVSDFRDLPFTSWSEPDDIRLQAKLLLQYTPLASATTLVSKGMCEAFIDISRIPEKYAKKVYVLSNGFSYTDANNAIKDLRKSNLPLKIVYTGTLYVGMQDASLLFMAIAELIQEGKITHDNICIEYAGNSGASLIKMAKDFGISSLVHDNGYVSRLDALKLQNEADLLLLLTWNTYLGRGIITGKMYEYILCKKPIICITSGDVPNSEATEMIRTYRLGIACESMVFKKSVTSLKEYLLMQIKRKQSGQDLEYHADYEALQEFNHDNLAIKLENICLKAVKEKEKNEYLYCPGLVSGK